MPHAWNAGEQVALLRRQLEAMEDGGIVVISAPANPVRCPPGALRARQPDRALPEDQEAAIEGDRARRQGSFSKQRLFQAAWKELYPGMIEWVALSKGGAVTSVEPATKTLVTDFGKHQAAVANVIPPQKAGHVAELAGVADRTGWCPVDPVTFESKLQTEHPRHRRRRHRRRDAELGFAAHSQGKVCAAAIAALLAGKTPEPPRADQHLLQPGRARLRHLAARHLPAGRRPVRRSRRRRDRQPARCAARNRARTKRSRPRPGPHHHRRGVRMKRPRVILLPAVALGRAAGAAQEALRPYRSSAMPFRSR